MQVNTGVVTQQKHKQATMRPDVTESKVKFRQEIATGPSNSEL